jgi:hypothetical protein
MTGTRARFASRLEIGMWSLGSRGGRGASKRLGRFGVFTVGGMSSGDWPVATIGEIISKDLA